jgi:hypothetical protein
VKKLSGRQNSQRKTKPRGPVQVDIIDIVKAQLATQITTSEADYAAAAAYRDSLISGLTARQRVHAKLCFGIADRPLNPVR